MINIILAFLAGVLCGGFCIYLPYREKFNWAMQTLRELHAKYLELNARLETLRLFYGVKEDSDV